MSDQTVGVLIGSCYGIVAGGFLGYLLAFLAIKFTKPKDRK